MRIVRKMSMKFKKGIPIAATVLHSSNNDKGNTDSSVRIRTRFHKKYTSYCLSETDLVFICDH